MATVKISVSISTDKVGSECEDILEFDKEEWDDMSTEERDEACQEAAFNMIEWDYQEV